MRNASFCIGNFRRVCPIFNRAIGKMKRHGKVTGYSAVCYSATAAIRKLDFICRIFRNYRLLVFRILLGRRVKHPESCFEILKALLNHPQVLKGGKTKWRKKRSESD